MTYRQAGLRLALAVALVPAFAFAASPMGTISDGPLSWSAPPFWSAPAVGSGERSARTALGRQALVTSPVPLPFVAVTPCRLVDTRGNGAPLTGGFLPAATTRSYTLTGICNIPANAKAISVNATVVNTAGPGFLVLWAQGGAHPPVSTLNFVTGQTVANAAVVPLSVSGGISMVLGVSGADVILDTNGYYSSMGVVNSLNTLGGDITLTPGTNVTITPSGNTLTIDAPLTVGPTGPVGPAGPVGATGPQGPTGATGTFDTQCVLSSTGWAELRNCLLAPVTVFDSIPSPTPPNVPSEGFECCSNSEVGDQITLSGTARKAVSATVLMSSWAKHSTYPTLSAAGFVHPITLNFYSDAAHAAAHNPDLGSFTQNMVLSWRPESDPTCPDTGYGAGWRAGDGNCYNGYAFPIVFTLSGVTLPNTFIYGIAYNTRSWGYSPLGPTLDGPYNSLNVGLNSTPPIALGTDVNPDAVWQSQGSPSGPYAPVTGWAPYTPAIRFSTSN